MAQLERGDFVRVKATSDHRPGQDGMVVAEDDGHAVGLIFGYDRYNQLGAGTAVTGTTGRPEEWLLSELDLSSIER